MAITELLMSERVARVLPRKVKNQLDAWAEHVDVLLSVRRNPRVMARMLPSAARGLFLRQGQSGHPTHMRAHHDAHFDWSYPSDFPQMAALYEKAKRLQWNTSTDIDWGIDVDPENTEIPVLPERFIAWDLFEEATGSPILPAERRRWQYDTVAWMLSQFLHGEQGALFAAAQVTECVPFMDGKFYGATQVVDEARHVEVFHRYLTTKIGKVYDVNDNLFTIIDNLMRDGRWDMKFLGMQILVEGLALGAFGMLHRMTHEPLLKSILRRVIHDEARHVRYGVLALREHMTREINERERREREDWAFEISMLMRNRFLAHELYEERFSAAGISRKQWNHIIGHSPGMQLFRTTMFSRLVPNLRDIGLLSPRIMPLYEKAGLVKYFQGRSALDLDADDLLAEETR